MHCTVYGRAVATVAVLRLGIAADTGRLDKKIPDLQGPRGEERGRNLKKRRGLGSHCVHAV